MKNTFFLIAFILVLCTLNSCKNEYNPHEYQSSTSLNGINIEYWMYQIQWLDNQEAIDALDATEYDMLVVEPGFNFNDNVYDVEYLVSSLKHKPNGDERILLAYIDIGQAEDYRTYWQSNWIAPTETTAGSPSFLVTIDPDGWSGNYPVAYWEQEWLDIWLADGGLIEQIANYGFDGVYLDWVEAYDDDKIREAATADGKSSETEMMNFIKGIQTKGQSVYSDFLVISQNAPFLLDHDPVFYASIIDGIATEDTWYYGEGDVEWDDNKAGDLSGGDRHAGEYSTENRIEQNKKYLDRDIPVFTVDYCKDENNANEAYHFSRKNGFIPIVTRVSLTHITETPPF